MLRCSLSPPCWNDDKIYEDGLEAVALFGEWRRRIGELRGELRIQKEKARRVAGAGLLWRRCAEVSVRFRRWAKP
jgi:hypothetical protein